jgi:hypothetical protein
MKKPPSSRPIDLKRVPAALALVAIATGCAQRADRTAVCPLSGGAEAERAPAGFASIAWPPVGKVHFPAGWQARLGPHSENLLSLSAPGGAAEVNLEASCCGGSDLPHGKAGEIARWSGRTFWIAQDRAGGRITQRYFAFPFAQVDTDRLRSLGGSAFRPPLGLSVRAACATEQACASVREVVRSIEYDPEATRLARQGDERVVRIGAAAARPAEAPSPGTAPGDRPPPPAPPPPEPIFTPELCGPK